MNKTALHNLLKTFKYDIGYFSPSFIVKNTELFSVSDAIEAHKKSKETKNEQEKINFIKIAEQIASTCNDYCILANYYSHNGYNRGNSEIALIEAQKYKDYIKRAESIAITCEDFISLYKNSKDNKSEYLTKAESLAINIKDYINIANTQNHYYYDQDPEDGVITKSGVNKIWEKYFKLAKESIKNLEDKIIFNENIHYTYFDEEFREPDTDYGILIPINQLIERAKSHDDFLRIAKICFKIFKDKLNEEQIQRRYEFSDRKEYKNIIVSCLKKIEDVKSINDRITIWEIYRIIGFTELADSFRIQAVSEIDKLDDNETVLEYKSRIAFIYYQDWDKKNISDWGLFTKLDNKYGNFLSSRFYSEMADLLIQNKSPKDEVKDCLEIASNKSEITENRFESISKYLNYLLVEDKTEKIEKYIQIGEDIISQIPSIKEGKKFEFLQKKNAISSLKELKKKIKEDEDKLRIKEEKIKKQNEDSFQIMLKRRIELEYALNKSALDELGLDEEAFYTELQNRVDYAGGKTDEKGKLIEINYFPIKKGKSWDGVKIWFRNFFLRNYRKEQLSYVLPSLRASYLGEWKEFLIDSGRIITGQKENLDKGKFEINIEHVKETSDKIQGMVDRFDQILKNDQERNLREKVFKWVILFLFVETFLVFWFVYSVMGSKESTANIQTLLNILLPATLFQISALVGYVVKSLFPNKEEKEKTVAELLAEIELENKKEDLKIKQKINMNTKEIEELTDKKEVARLNKEIEEYKKGK